jgi:hypothetical protein
VPLTRFYLALHLLEVAVCYSVLGLQFRSYRLLLFFGSPVRSCPLLLVVSVSCRLLEVTVPYSVLDLQLEVSIFYLLSVSPCLLKVTCSFSVLKLRSCHLLFYISCSMLLVLQLEVTASYSVSLGQPLLIAFSYRLFSECDQKNVDV